ncbi:MAG: dihydroneopterin aldolase [SAR202 cluster bacterium Io17-Chloro-G7]|nr:MAG: dihydroneopterin aldolase [SAR202 cluster bacterium Io17-Chloro-G7]
MDRVILEGMQLYGFHGANPEERAQGQLYIVDLSVELDLKKPGISDLLEDTVNYTHLFRAVQTVVEGESKSLLEAVAQAIASKVLAEFPVQAVRVCLKKPRPPIRRSVIAYAAVEIYRTRGDVT